MKRWFLSRPAVTRRGSPGLLAALVLVVVGVSSGCAVPPPPRTVATLRAADLPADPVLLLARLDPLSQAHDRVSLENALVVADRLLALETRADPDGVVYEGSWRAARAAFWLADEAEGDKGRRAYFAQRGIRYADRAVAANPKRVEGVYYRALDRGYLTQTKTVGAIELVGDLARDAKAAIALDETYDDAGPLRLYGTLLLKAPGWPASIGDPDEAMEQLGKAVKIAPGHPLNHFYYGAALLANDKPAEARAQVEEAVKLAEAPQWAYLRGRLRTEADKALAKAAKQQK